LVQSEQQYPIFRCNMLEHSHLATVYPAITDEGTSPNNVTGACFLFANPIAMRVTGGGWAETNHLVARVVEKNHMAGAA